MRTVEGRERAEGGVGTWWRGAMEGKKRNNCNNLNNKDLLNFKKKGVLASGPRGH